MAESQAVFIRESREKGLANASPVSSHLALSTSSAKAPNKNSWVVLKIENKIITLLLQKNNNTPPSETLPR